MTSEIKRFLRGFGYAANGVVCCVRTQRNMRFHICAAAAVFSLAKICGFGREKIVLLILTVSSVMAAEAFNTAAEYTVDLCTREISPLAAKAKDCAAGAVLITAVFAAAVGIVMFGNAEVLSAAAEWFGSSLLRCIALPVYVMLSFLFVFVFGEKKPPHGE